MDNLPGLWICIDGPDFTGKGAQSTELIARLIKDNEDNVVTYTHEPTRNARRLKEKLRAEQGDAYRDPKVMTKLFIEDRAGNEREVIRPNLDSGGIVLSNRHKYATFVYQAVQGMSIDELIRMHKELNIGTPDITLFLFCDDDSELRRRMAKTGKTLDKFEGDFEFQRKVAAKYRELVQIAPQNEASFGNIYPIDTSDKSIVQVSEAVWGIIEPVYRRWAQKRDAWTGNV